MYGYCLCVKVLRMAAQLIQIVPYTTHEHTEKYGKRLSRL